MSAGPVQCLRALEQHRDLLPEHWRRKVDVWRLLVGRHFDMRNLSTETHAKIRMLVRLYGAMWAQQ